MGDLFTRTTQTKRSTKNMSNHWEKSTKTEIERDTLATDLNELDDLAGDEAHVPCLGDVLEGGGNETEDDDEEVGDREVDDEDVGDAAHVQVARDGVADEQVADDADEEDERVEEQDEPLERRRHDVVVHLVEVLVFRDAVLVEAHLQRVVRRHVEGDVTGCVF